VFAPAWVPFVHGGAHLGFWRPHTFLQSLALVPAGLVLLPATILLASPLAAAFGPIAATLLGSSRRVEEVAARGARTPAADARTGLRVHAIVDAGVVLVLSVIWALTSRGYFWPVWVALPLALALWIHGVVVRTAEDPALLRSFRGSRGLAIHAGVLAGLAAFLTVIWAITSRGYFWPMWPILAFAIALAAHALALPSARSGEAELAERIETLESTRAGAVDAQDSELRRIERDLHDGAQARLVALGMSLGMAEQKLADDPVVAGELLAEARAGAEEALRELRDLARGIHPPVLADRGLEAALAALVTSTPMHVTLSVDVPERPAPAVESAAYFVVAEALANATKHAGANRVDIRIAREGDGLALEVTDDGRGGADPRGAGLSGLRRRVEALDGRLSVTSPPGGPTTLRAELPCA
jgi:signal transduction histidine kinase